MTGLGAPHWDPYDRGAMVGLTRGCTRAHLARAALEAIAYQTFDAVQAMEGAYGEPLQELHVDGGATVNSWLMQFQADISGVPIVVADMAETTAKGAALISAVGANLLTMDDVVKLGQQGTYFEPRMAEDERATLLAGWHDALTRSRADDSVHS